MGFDFLDMVFRLERQFGLKIKRGELESLFKGRQPPDATAEELRGYIVTRLWGTGSTDEPQGPMDRDVRCSDCDYNLRGLQSPFVCPECGTALYWKAALRPGLVGVAVGGFGGAAVALPTRSVWEQSKHDWVRLGAEIPGHVQGSTSVRTR